jgi:methyl-accepting chemotaxis protein
MRLSIKLKLAFILAASALGMIGTVGTFTLLLRSSQNTLAAINAQTRAEFEAAFSAVEQAARIQDFTLKLVREKDLDNIESLMKQSEAATRDLREHLRDIEGWSSIRAAFDALTKANDHVRDAVMAAEGARAHSIFVEESTPAFQALLKAIREQQQQYQKKQDAETARAATRLVVTQTIVTVAGGILSALIIFIGVLLTRSISNALSRIVEKVRAVAGGDLRISLEDEGAQQRTLLLAVSGGAADEEIGNLYHAFNDMLESLRSLQGRVAAAFQEMEQAIGDVTSLAGGLQSGADKQSRSVDEIAEFISRVNEQAGGVARSMEAQAHKSEETSSSILELMSSIEEVSKNADSLSASVEDTSSSIVEVLNSNKEVSHNMEALNALVSKASAAVAQIDTSIKEVQTLAQDSQQISNEVKESAQKDGSAVVEAAIGEMTRIRAAVLALSGTVSKLSVSVGNIGEILAVIEHVAQQTNLLALNAAIIAAQAGEHGRSFAVVADEIRALAERTTSSTQEISNVIAGIQTETRNVGSLVSEGVERVDAGVQTVNRTHQALKNIIASSERAQVMSSRIARSTAEQASGSREVAHSIKAVVDLSAQISRATVEQAQGSTSIIRAVENMRELAEHVRRAMGEQTAAARLISKASVDSNQLSQEVTKASQESKQLVERVVSEASNIRTSAKDTLAFVSRMNEIVEGFDALAGHLKSTLSQFQTH